MPISYAPIKAGSGGVLLEAPDTLPESGVLALAVNAAGKMSSVAFPSTTRETLGLATTDSPTFAGVKLNGILAGVGTAANDTIQTATHNGIRDGGDSGYNFRCNTVDVFRVQNFGSIGAVVGLDYSYGFSNSAANIRFADLFLFRDAANTLAQRNGTNGQKSRIYKTYTSATSGEWLELDAATDASNFDIAASIGSAGGTARGIRIGGKNAAGTFSPWLSFATTGAATFSGAVRSTNDMDFGAGSQLTWSATGQLRWTGIGLLRIANVSASSGVVFDVGTDATLRLRNRANDADSSLTASNITASGTINPRTGTATAGTAPIKIATGTLMTTPEAGAIEYDGTNLYFTDSGGTRRQLAVV